MNYEYKDPDGDTVSAHTLAWDMYITVNEEISVRMGPEQAQELSEFLREWAERREAQDFLLDRLAQAGVDQDLLEAVKRALP